MHSRNRALNGRVGKEAMAPKKISSTQLSLLTDRLMQQQQQLVPPRDISGIYDDINSE